jgi:hypothetical protein
VSEFAYILESIRQQTPEETRSELSRAGVITDDGELTPKYSSKPKATKKSLKARIANAPSV